MLLILSHSLTLEYFHTLPLGECFPGVFINITGLVLHPKCVCYSVNVGLKCVCYYVNIGLKCVCYCVSVSPKCVRYYVSVALKMCLLLYQCYTLNVFVTMPVLHPKCVCYYVSVASQMCLLVCYCSSAQLRGLTNAE